MSGKKQLTKQRITYGSLGDSNSREKEEFADKQSIGKRVSFEAPSLSSDDDDDDSNVENTFGRSNLTLGKRDSFGGLFGGSSFGDRQISDGFAKSSADDIIAKDSEHPRPAPRRHPPIISPKQSHTGSHSAVTSQLSAHNPDVEGTLVTWPVKAKGKQPVPVPRTSPQNNHSDSSSLDTNSPRPIPRSRPKLSPREGTLLNKLKTTDLRDTFEERAPQAENIIDSTVGDKPRSRGTRPLKANQELNEMTKSPQLKETVQKRNWTERKPPSRGSSPVPRRASSMTNLRGRSPDSSWRQGSNAKALDRLDSSSIRQAVYDEWLTKKHSILKEQVASKVSEKKKQEEKEEEERQRKQLAKRAFDSWNEKKQEANRELSAKKKELMKKEFEKQREKNLKARDAKKYFESWKGKKDDELKEKHQKKREEMKEKKKKEQEEKQETKSNAKRAFKNWKGRKDEVIKEEIKKKKKEEMENAMKEEDEKYERSIQCAERYQAWVEKKGKPRRGPPPPTLTQRGWCPSGRKSGNCIPETVQSVIQVPTPNRSRTLSGTMLRSRKF